MLLSDYLTREGITQTEFGRRIKKSQAYVSGLCRGAWRPSMSAARKISAETGGAVGLDDWPGIDEDAA